HGIPLATRLGRGLLALASVQLNNLWAPALIGAAYLARRPNRSSSAWLLAAVFMSACAYSVYVGGDAWEWMLYSNRYITPAVPALLVLAALGIERFVDSAPAGWRRLLLPICFLAVFGLTVHDLIPKAQLQIGPTPGVQAGAL